MSFVCTRMFLLSENIAVGFCFYLIKLIEHFSLIIKFVLNNYLVGLTDTIVHCVYYDTFVFSLRFIEFDNYIFCAPLPICA